MDQVMSALSPRGHSVCKHTCKWLLCVLFRTLSCLVCCCVVLCCDLLAQGLQPCFTCEDGLGRYHITLLCAVSQVPMVALAVSVFQRRIVGTALTKRPVLSLPVSA